MNAHNYRRSSLVHFTKIFKCTIDFVNYALTYYINNIKYITKEINNDMYHYTNVRTPSNKQAKQQNVSSAIFKIKIF